MRSFILAVSSSVATFALVMASTVTSRSQAVLSALPTEVVAPSDNAATPDKVALGRLLFWDPILSGQKDVSCATCHHPSFGYAENLDLSIGAGGHGLGASRAFGTGRPVRFVKRNSQTILNAAFNGLVTGGTYRPSAAPMFWDSRVESLEAQALEPIKALEEMRGDAYSDADALSTVVARLAANAEYRTHFARAFGNSPNPVTVVNLGRAIAAFERTLVAVNSPFDRYMRGDSAAMTPQQVRGMERFQSAGCAACHSGPMLSDFTVHVVGAPDNDKLAQSDAGVGSTYAFRTPSLRNLAYTAPYMHSGVFNDLDDVVAFYNRVGGGGRGGRGGGGGRGRNPNVSRTQLDPLVRQLNLRGGGRGGGQRDIVAFLGALNDPSFDRTIPDRVPSGLTVGGS
jgi:cytochrome c peroxidase